MLDKILLLLAEENEADRKRCVQALCNLGAEIREATNGRETLDLLDKEQFDCIILDHILPDFDGLALVKEIRRLGYLTPIVVTTGHGDERLAVDMLKAGAQDYIPKDRVEDLLPYAIVSAIESSHVAKESEYYKNFYNNAPIGFFTTSLEDGAFVNGNQAIVDLLEFDSIEDLKKSRTLDLYSKPEHREKLLKPLVEGQSLIGSEIPLTTAKGNLRWFDISARLCRGLCRVQGRCLPNCTGKRCVEGSLTDISEKKNLELEIERLKQERAKELVQIQKAIKEKLCAYA